MRIRLPLLCAIALLMPNAASGACSGPGPSFRNGAASAATVVIGTVTDGKEHDGAGPVDGYFRAFRLEVDHVLRGEAPPVMSIDNVPMHCAGPIEARAGDVIAVALGAHEFDTEVTAVAFIAGVPHRSDIERLTLAEAYGVTGVSMPPIGEARTATPWPLMLAVGILSVSALLAFALPTRRRRG